MTAVRSTPAHAAPARKCRVTFVIGTMGAGGAERQILAYLQHFDRARFAVSLYLDHQVGELLDDVPEDVEIVSFWQASGWLGWLLRKVRPVYLGRGLHLMRFLRRWRPDVLYERTFMATVQSARFAHWVGVPRVAAAVAEPEPEVQRWFPQRIPQGYRRARAAYQQASVVVCNSRHLQTHMQEYFQLSESQLETLPNVLDPRRLPAAPAMESEADTAPASDNIDVRDRTYHLVNVGRLDPEKGVFDLIEALQRLIIRDGWKLHLHLIGTGPSQADLQRQVAACGLQSAVTFHGFQANPLERVVQCDLFVFPSHSEGSPNALIEALACGVPVIAADSPTGGPREILDDGRWGRLVPVRDAAALADAIAQALRSLPEARCQAAAAAVAIRQRHDLQAGVRRLEDLLWQVAHHERAAAR